MWFFCSSCESFYTSIVRKEIDDVIEPWYLHVHGKWSLPSHNAWQPACVGHSHVTWSFSAKQLRVHSTLHSCPRGFPLLGNPATTNDRRGSVAFVIRHSSIISHFCARHCRLHSQQTIVPNRAAAYATTNPPTCCFLAFLCFSCSSWRCFSVFWLQFWIGEKGPHSVAI